MGSYEMPGVHVHKKRKNEEGEEENVRKESFVREAKDYPSPSPYYANMEEFLIENGKTDELRRFNQMRQVDSALDAIDVDALWEKMYLHAKKVIIPCSHCQSHNAISNAACVRCGAPMGDSVDLA